MVHDFYIKRRGDDDDEEVKKLPDSFDWFTDRNLTSTFTAKYFSWEAAGTQEKSGKT